jgi:hypothetical protein
MKYQFYVGADVSESTSDVAFLDLQNKEEVPITLRSAMTMGA